MNSPQVLIKPIITEKSTAMAQKKVYSFEVDTRASKHQIASAIESMYGVVVKTIRTLTRKGKEKKVGKKMKMKRMSDRKLAQIVLSKGTIDSFPQS